MRRSTKKKKADLSKSENITADQLALQKAKAEEKHKNKTFIFRGKKGLIIECKTKERLEEYKKTLGI